MHLPPSRVVVHALYVLQNIMRIFLATSICLILISCNQNGTTSSIDDTDADQLIELAVTEGNVAEVKRLLDEGFPVEGTSDHVNAPAFWAIYSDQSDILRILIEHGLDVNFDWGFDGGNLLTNAVQIGHTDIVRILLESGATTERDPEMGRTPLYAAVIYREDEIRQLLIDHGATLNSWDREALPKLGYEEHIK
jgi:uncharacterized protein